MDSVPLLTSAARVAAVRAEMRRAGVELFIVRGTDRYLNEYVPRAESSREWVTGFTGSTGDALIGLDAAWLFVDGRYHVQADREIDAGVWTVVKSAFGVTNEKALGEKLIELAAKCEGDAALAAGYEPERYAVKTFDALEEQLRGVAVSLRPLAPSPIDRVRGEVPFAITGDGRLRVLDESSVGRSVGDKVKDIAAWLTTRRADALVVSKLDEIAWLTNLRGSEASYATTFRAEAVATRDAVLLCVHAAPVTDELRARCPGVRFVAHDELFSALKEAASKGRKPRVALDPASVSVATRDAFAALPAEVLALESPIVKAKAKKNPTELAAMKRAFAKADSVVAEAQRWLLGEVSNGARVSETDFARKVESLFLAAGAVGLSFKVISAFGLNGASVHHPPSDSTLIEAGQLMLLDTGCYFEEGYATDLTRTFFVGGAGDAPTTEQQRLYTMTLRSAIAGMTARVAKGAVGAQLDGITRAPLWAEGLDYAHGTGHGVGINVHESPPGVTKMSTLGIEEGHVFSIEPGLYVEGVGGVRIENLCTVTAEGEKEGFLRVEPLTFAPLDARLIDDSLLNDREREFVAWYATRPSGAREGS
jgi:Xaa-Pro aminopeptidase